jgi:hypothetical protein
VAEVAPDPVAADARGHTLTHDFGVVRPAGPLTHSFRISNPTGAAWTFERFTVSCGCTVPSASAEAVPPGGSAEVLFRYTPPAEPSDDHRSVEVVFREPAAPRLRLQVAARVRHPLTAFPVRLTLRRLPHGRPHVERVEVENTTPGDLPPPRLAGNRPWLRVGEPEPRPARPGVRQLWAVPVTVLADALPPGEHAGTVTAAPGQAHPEGLTLPVAVQVVPPLEPTPSQLFFGTAAVGKPATVTFAVRLPADIPADSLALSHDLGKLLTTARVAAEAGRAGFTATLTPAAAGMIRGTLRVRCGDPAVPETTLPVVAMGSADAR